MGHALIKILINRAISRKWILLFQTYKDSDKVVTFDNVYCCSKRMIMHDGRYCISRDNGQFFLDAVEISFICRL